MSVRLEVLQVHHVLVRVEFEVFFMERYKKNEE